MAEDLVDRVRGATQSALKDWEKGEASFWELVAALDRLFPGVKPVPHPADIEAAEQMHREMSAGIQNASVKGEPAERADIPA